MDRRWTVIGSGLLSGVLAVVVLYSNKITFHSPIAILVFAAVGMLALTLRLRLRPRAGSSIRMPLWLNAVGILAALVALGVDFYAQKRLAPVFALVAIACFVISGGWALQDLRKRRSR